MAYNSALADEIIGIITLHPERHDQDSYMEFTRSSCPTPLQARDDCGTTACVAGWAAILTLPATWRLGGNDYAFYPGACRRSYFDIGMDALGITTEQADWLFAGYRTKAEVLWALKWLGDHPDADACDLRQGWRRHTRDELA